MPFSVLSLWQTPPMRQKPALTALMHPPSEQASSVQGMLSLQFTPLHMMASVLMSGTAASLKSTVWLASTIMFMSSRSALLSGAPCASGAGASLLASSASRPTSAGTACPSALVPVSPATDGKSGCAVPCSSQAAVRSNRAAIKHNILIGSSSVVAAR